jgi:hypothetical protein
LIGRIHDRALDPGLWSDTIGRAVDAAGAHAGMVTVHDPPDHAGVHSFRSGVPASAMEVHARRHAGETPLAPFAAARCSEGGVGTLASVFPDGARKRSRTRRGRARPPRKNDVLAWPCRARGGPASGARTVATPSPHGPARAETSFLAALASGRTAPEAADRLGTAGRWGGPAWSAASGSPEPPGNRG